MRLLGTHIPKTSSLHPKMLGTPAPEWERLLYWWIQNPFWGLGFWAGWCVYSSWFWVLAPVVAPVHITQYCVFAPEDCPCQSYLVTSVLLAHTSQWVSSACLKYVVHFSVFFFCFCPVHMDFLTILQGPVQITTVPVYFKVFHDLSNGSLSHHWVLLQFL